MRRTSHEVGSLYDTTPGLIGGLAYFTSALDMLCGERCKKRRSCFEEMCTLGHRFKRFRETLIGLSNGIEVTRSPGSREV
jgi:hypothetical protein